MHYNWRIYGRYKCPKCGWHLARKKKEHEQNVSLCCRCKSPMKEIDPKTHEYLDGSTDDDAGLARCFDCGETLIAPYDGSPYYCIECSQKRDLKLR